MLSIIVLVSESPGTITSSDIMGAISHSLTLTAYVKQSKNKVTSSAPFGDRIVVAFRDLPNHIKLIKDFGEM